MGGLSCPSVGPSLGLVKSVVDSGANGELSPDLTLLVRLGAGAGGGSFPAASKDVLSLSVCNKFLMNAAR